MSHQTKNIVISVLLISLSLSFSLNVVQSNEKKAINNEKKITNENLDFLKITYSCLFSDMELIASALINNVAVDIFLKAIPECIIYESDGQMRLGLNSLEMTADSISQKITNIEIEKIGSIFYVPCFRLMLPPTGTDIGIDESDLIKP